jgi:hypothetical protein
MFAIKKLDLLLVLKGHSFFGISDNCALKGHGFSRAIQRREELGL